jgi:hypothetical protein
VITNSYVVCGKHQNWAPGDRSFRCDVTLANGVRTAACGPLGKVVCRAESDREAVRALLARDGVTMVAITPLVGKVALMREV